MYICAKYMIVNFIQIVANVLLLSDYLSFVYLKSYTNVSRGDDTYGSSVSPDVTFRFGNTYTSNIYVSLTHIKSNLRRR